MGDGSFDERRSIPSAEPTNHPDPRMHWRIGAGDIDPCNITHRVPAGCEDQPAPVLTRGVTLVVTVRGQSITIEEFL